MVSVPSVVRGGSTFGLLVQGRGAGLGFFGQGEGAARCSSHATGQVHEGPEHPAGLGVGKGGVGASANSLSHLTRIQGALPCAQHGARSWGHSGEQDG